MELLYLVFLLQVKHLLIDWILQPKWMWSNKGTYGHPGGIIHALLNALGTSFIISIYYDSFWIVLIIDFILHYHIDWAKMYILKLTKWSYTNKKFWYLTGFDQFLHQITYILILGVII